MSLDDVVRQTPQFRYDFAESLGVFSLPLSWNASGFMANYERIRASYFRNLITAKCNPARRRSSSGR